MKTERLSQIPKPLISWFEENARILPWRNQEPDGRLKPDGANPYYVWVSEIMLQQTRVEAVKPYFLRFTEALPDAGTLAECPENQLLKLWEGLGYYNRVRNMQKAAQIITEKYGGYLPADYEALLSLPGIGSYTAGAVASIAYGISVPAVDGNVLRVVSRICGSYEDITKQSVKTFFEQELKKVLLGLTGEKKNIPGIFNQALMELGALVCVPNGAPDCENCPVKDICFAKEHSCQMELPVKAPKKGRRIEKRTVLVIRDSEHGAVRRRPSRGLLAGLYELPNLSGHLTQEEALQQVRSYGFSPIRITPLSEAKHIFSHIEWQMQGYMVLVEDAEPGQADPGILFIDPRRTEDEYPIPAAFGAYTKYLSIRLGQDKFRESQEE